MKTRLFTRRSFLPRPVEWFAIVVARMLYRVRFRGSEKIPEKGGALIVANHLSYVDVVVLQLACPRRLRFMGYEGFLRQPFFRLMFKYCGAIPISPEKPIEGTRAAIRALQAGDVICLFPEGNISRTGQLMEIRPGFEIMARKAHVPVIPAAIDGLWGSLFSFAGNKYLWKSPRLTPTDVFVAFGDPVAPEQATAGRIRQEILDLTEEAFQERPVLKRHIAREVVRSFARHPGRVVVIDRTASRQPLKAAQLFAAAAVLSRRIKKTVPEERVGIVLPAGAGCFIANLAVAFAGKSPVNLNFTAGKTSLESSLLVGNIRTVITADLFKPKVAHFPWPEHTVDLRKEIEASGGKKAMIPWLLALWVFPNQWIPGFLGLPKVGDRAEAGLLFTSGSAGEPKGVSVSHRNLLANCAQISSMAILPSSATMLACLPVFHSFGFTVNFWYPMIRGCKVVTIPSPLDTRRMIDAISEEEASVLVAAPTFLRPLLKKAEPAELKSLDLVVAGAEKLSEELFNSYREKFHVDILEGYGLTETSPVSAVNQPTPPIVASSNEPQVGKKFGTVGRLLPGMTARIVDPDTFAPLPAESTGMLLLKGPNIFGGYLKDPEKTRTALREGGWFVTGDLARFDKDGFVSIVGRLSRFSKIGGEMVPHGTVEQKIAQAFGWDGGEAPAVVVVGLPDPAKGEQLVLISIHDVSPEALRAKLGEMGLPNLWIPKVICRVEAIPLLGTGKVDLRSCKAIAQNFVAEAKV